MNRAFTKSFGGSSVETSTSLFLILSILLSLIAAVSIRNIRQVYVNLVALMAGVSAILLIIFLKIISVYGLLPTALLASVPDSLAITMIDAAILAAAMIILSINMFLVAPLQKWLKTTLWAIIIFSLLFLGAVNFKPAMVILAIFAIAHTAFIFRTTHKKQVSSISVSVATIVLIIFSSSLGTFLSTHLKISNLDVRPSFSTSVSLVGQAWKSNALLGVGPNQFSNLWNQNKPVEVNQTNFWSVGFQNGYSSFLTWSAELGIVGTLALLLFLFIFFSVGFRSTRISLPLFSLTAFLWLITFVYAPGIVVLSLTFLLTGIFAATIYLDTQVKSISLHGMYKFIPIVLILVALGGAYFTGKKIQASFLFNRAALEANTNLEAAGNHLIKAALVAPADVYWRSVSGIYLNQVQTILGQSTDSISEEVKSNLQANVSNAIAAAKNAVALDSKDYLNWFSLGSVYESLARVGIAGSQDSANEAYNNSAKVAPTNPALPLALARLSLIAGDSKTALEQINQSLTLKTNFTDAYFLKAQIEVAEGNPAAAISSVSSAAASDPTNAGLLFQLGLLKYQTNDYIGATEAFEAAVQIVPDYANAKYFLGLSYYKLGRIENSILQFEEVDVTNPDNQEIQLVLSNLRAGNDPFTGAKPPIDNKPEDRQSPPIDESL